MSKPGHLVDGAAAVALKDSSANASPNKQLNDNHSSSRENIRHTVEYYFSQANLPFDDYLLARCSRDGFAEISTVSNFTLIKKLTNNVQNTELVAASIEDSAELELSADRKRVRSRRPFVPVDLKSFYGRSVLVVNLAVNAKYQRVKNTFSRLADVVDVKMMRPLRNTTGNYWQIPIRQAFAELAEITGAVLQFESAEKALAVISAIKAGAADQLKSLPTADGATAVCHWLGAVQLRGDLGQPPVPGSRKQSPFVKMSDAKQIAAGHHRERADSDPAVGRFASLGTLAVVSRSPPISVRNSHRTQPQPLAGVDTGAAQPKLQRQPLKLIKLPKAVVVLREPTNPLEDVSQSNFKAHPLAKRLESPGLVGLDSHLQANSVVEDLADQPTDQLTDQPAAQPADQPADVGPIILFQMAADPCMDDPADQLPPAPLPQKKILTEEEALKMVLTKKHHSQSEPLISRLQSNEAQANGAQLNGLPSLLSHCRITSNRFTPSSGHGLF